MQPEQNEAQQQAEQAEQGRDPPDQVLALRPWYDRPFWSRPAAIVRTNPMWSCIVTFLIVVSIDTMVFVMLDGSRMTFAAGLLIEVVGGAGALLLARSALRRLEPRAIDGNTDDRNAELKLAFPSVNVLVLSWVASGLVWGSQLGARLAPDPGDDPDKPKPVAALGMTVVGVAFDAFVFCVVTEALLILAFAFAAFVIHRAHLLRTVPTRAPTSSTSARSNRRCRF